MAEGRPSAPYRTDRLELRAWTPDDAEAHFDVYSRWEVMRWLGADPQPLTDRERSIAGIERWRGREDPPFGIWAVVPDEVGHPIGTALLVPLQDGDGNPVEEVEVGWHFHPDHWGRGYATESAQRLLDLAWEVGLPEVWAVIHPGNDASVAVTRRLGMRPEGLTERWYGVPLESYRISAPA